MSLSKTDNIVGKQELKCPLAASGRQSLCVCVFEFPGHSRCSVNLCGGDDGPVVEDFSSLLRLSGSQCGNEG